MEHVRIDLAPGEYRALARLCELELRPLPDQVRHVLRQALRRRGLLPPVRPPAEREGHDAA